LGFGNSWLLIGFSGFGAFLKSEIRPYPYNAGFFHLFLTLPEKVDSEVGIWVLGRAGPEK